MKQDVGIRLSAGERRRRAALAWLGKSVLFLMTSIAALAVLTIILFIARDALPFFYGDHAGEFFFSREWYPSSEPPIFGARAIFAGSLIVTAVAILIAVPPGILAAVCLSDILPFSVRQVVKPVVEMLSAIPSVVYGFFALVVLAPKMQSHLGASSGTNALTASIILAVMALPTIVSVSEDALQAAGRELREGSYALGATRAETLLKVILPAAISGVLAAVLLGIMRALGETMVVWMASGNAAQIPSSLLDPVRTLTATIAGDMGEADQSTGSMHYHVLFAMGLMLLLFSFACSMAGEWVVGRQRKKLRGE